MATPLPSNAAHFTAREVAHITRGELRGADLALTGVGTDTRGELRGKLFVALRGERFDAHTLAAAAVAAGAAALLVEAEIPEVAVPVIRVPSTRIGLAELARFHRRRWGQTVVAVAGSAGKTTTKSTLARGLELLAPGAVHSVSGNLNNEIGVPLVLLGLMPQHRYAVVEIGTNAPGEVAALTRSAEPDVGVLTVIGLEHSEGLGDLEAIEAEEGALLRLLPAAGVALGNADDTRVLRQLDQSPARRRITFGASVTADYRLLRRTWAESRQVLSALRPSGIAAELSTPLLGKAGASATLAAFAVAEALAQRTLDAVAFSAVLATGLGEAGRLCALQASGNTLLLDDTYNSNPVSLLSSLHTAREVAEQRGARLLLVLGEMRELGPFSEAAHREAGLAIAAQAPDVLVAVGAAARGFLEPSAAQGREALGVADAAAAAAEVLRRVRPGDVLLFKASRGVGLERAVADVLKGLGGAL